MANDLPDGVPVLTYWRGRRIEDLTLAELRAALNECAGDLRRSLDELASGRRFRARLYASLRRAPDGTLTLKSW